MHQSPGGQIRSGFAKAANTGSGHRRRSAIEAEIGRMKTDGRLSRCLLKGTFGDTLFAVLCDCGYNIREILAHLRALCARTIAMLLNALPGVGPDHKALKSA